MVHTVWLHPHPIMERNLRCIEYNLETCCIECIEDRIWNTSNTNHQLAPHNTSCLRKRCMPLELSMFDNIKVR
jgi:hypothetical protein